MIERLLVSKKQNKPRENNHVVIAIGYAAVYLFLLMAYLFRGLHCFR